MNRAWRVLGSWILHHALPQKKNADWGTQHAARGPGWKQRNSWGPATELATLVMPQSCHVVGMSLLSVTILCWPLLQPAKASAVAYQSHSAKASTVACQWDSAFSLSCCAKRKIRHWSVTFWTDSLELESDSRSLAVLGRCSNLRLPRLATLMDESHSRSPWLSGCLWIPSMIV